MTIQIEPHYRLQILPNVGGVVKEDGIDVYAEVRNTAAETVTSANVVAVGYTSDGTLCAVEESSSYLTLREGETKAVKVHLDTDAKTLASLRLYAETEFDDDDPGAVSPELAEPPTFMLDYFHRDKSGGA